MFEHLMDELVCMQRAKLLRLAQELFPQITTDDLLQPQDFPLLEQNPYFRYEEGVLEGLLTARMALLARDSTSDGR